MAPAAGVTGRKKGFEIVEGQRMITNKIRQEHYRTEFCFTDLKKGLSPSKLGLITRNNAKLLQKMRLSSPARELTRFCCDSELISDIKAKNSLSSPFAGFEVANNASNKPSANAAVAFVPPR